MLELINIDENIQNLETNPRSIINHDFFNIIDNEQKAYWLGFFYADGYIVNTAYNGNYRIGIGLSVRDEQHLQKFANIFNKKLIRNFQTCPLSDSEKLNERVIINLNCKEMWTELQNKGITSNKTHQEDGKILKFIAPELMNHFIRGFFDGDGCITKNSKRNAVYRVNFVGTKGFLTEIQKIMVNTLDINLNKIEQQKNIYIIQWSGIGQLQTIYHWFYDNATIYLERKKLIFEQFTNIVPKTKQFGSNLAPQNAQYKGIWQRKNKSWSVRVEIFGKRYYGGTYDTALDAAYKHDYIQVKIRENKAKEFMNFPEHYDVFKDLIDRNVKC